MKDILLIFDLNGTLLQRVKTSLEKKLVNENVYNPHYDFQISKSVQVFVRPHLQQMLQGFSKRIYIAVWTSAQIQNAKKLSDKLFPPQHQQLTFLLDRTHCENAPMNVKSDNVVKNLDIVFKSKELSDEYFWTNKNTILIDDSPSKARKQPENLLTLPTFTVLDPTKDPQKDDYLLRLLKWTEMIPSDFDDIKLFIKQHPLSSITLNKS
jgi:hypothetical protein